MTDKTVAVLTQDILELYELCLSALCADTTSRKNLYLSAILYILEKRDAEQLEALHKTLGWEVEPDVQPKGLTTLLAQKGLIEEATDASRID